MALTAPNMVCVPVADRARARDFYVGNLGFRLSADREMMGANARWITVCPTGDDEQMISLVTWFRSMAADSLQGLLIGIDDADAEYARLKANGVDVDEPRPEPWGRYLSLCDSEGNGLVFRAPPCAEGAGA